MLAAKELETLSKMRRFALCTRFEETKGDPQRRVIDESAAFLLHQAGVTNDFLDRKRQLTSYLKSGR